MWLGLEKVWSRKKQSTVLFGWLRSFLPEVIRKVMEDEDKSRAEDARSSSKSIVEDGMPSPMTMEEEDSSSSKTMVEDANSSSKIVAEEALSSS